MGTNFYLVENECSKCGRADQRHIGKQSGGWQFHFQGHTEPQLASARAWFAHIRKAVKSGGFVRDENGRVYKPDEFKAVVEKSKSEPCNFAKYARPDIDHQDKDGWWFSLWDFS